MPKPRFLRLQMPSVTPIISFSKRGFSGKLSLQYCQLPEVKDYQVGKLMKFANSLIDMINTSRSKHIGENRPFRRQSWLSRTFVISAAQCTHSNCHHTSMTHTLLIDASFVGLLADRVDHPKEAHLELAKIQIQT